MWGKWQAVGGVTADAAPKPGPARLAGPICSCRRTAYEAPRPSGAFAFGVDRDPAEEARLTRINIMEKKLLEIVEELGPQAGIRPVEIPKA